MKFSGVEVERILTRYGRVYAPKADSVIGRSLRTYGEWAEQEIGYLSTCIENDGIIVDVGGNLGTHTLALAKRHPNCHVFTFEPSAFTFSLLSSTAVFNGLENVTLFNMGCSTETGISFVDLDYENVGLNYGAASFTTRGESHLGGMPFAFVSLDSISFDRKVELIKIDVEGMEYDVIAGAKSVIAKHSPFVFLEVLETSAAFRCSDLLTEYGYRCFWVSTSAYNADNFNRYPENVWGHGELSLLAVPPRRALPDFAKPDRELSEAHLLLSTGEILERFPPLVSSAA